MRKLGSRPSCVLSLLFFGCSTYGNLVPQPGIEPGAKAVKAPNPNYQIARKFPQLCSSRAEWPVPQFAQLERRWWDWIVSEDCPRPVLLNNGIRESLPCALRPSWISPCVCLHLWARWTPFWFFKINFGVCLIYNAVLLSGVHKVNQLHIHSYIHCF